MAKKSVTYRLPVKLVEALNERAKKEKRNITQQLEIALMQHLNINPEKL